MINNMHCNAVLLKVYFQCRVFFLHHQLLPSRSHFSLFVVECNTSHESDVSSKDTFPERYLHTRMEDPEKHGKLHSNPNCEIVWKEIQLSLEPRWVKNPQKRVKPQEALHWQDFPFHSVWLGLKSNGSLENNREVLINDYVITGAYDFR